jgi:hypothetical protein
LRVVLDGTEVAGRLQAGIHQQVPVGGNLALATPLHGVLRMVKGAKVLQEYLELFPVGEPDGDDVRRVEA